MAPATLGEELLRRLPPLLFPLWPLWVAVGTLVLVRVSAALYRRIRLLRSGIREIDRMEGWEFEECLERLFRRLGYAVEQTRYSGDFGADLVLTRKGKGLVVQAKRSRGRVGVR